MKKYLILATAALAASAACTKTELSVTPDVPVTFQVADYKAQTKVGETTLTSVTTSFSSQAFLHAEGVDLNADGSVNGTSWQNFFQPTSGNYVETVTWDGTNKIWAPGHTYYWPKGDKSFVNFVSWYSKNSTVPTVGYAYTSSKWTATLTWNLSSLAADEDLLVADAAWRYKSNADAAYKLDGVTEGVPTLFRHILSQVQVKAYVAATSQTGTGLPTDATAIWNVTLKNVKIGSVYTATDAYTLTNVDPESKTTQAWTVGAFTASDTKGNLTPAADVPVKAITSAAADDVIAIRTVLPQTIADDIALSFDLDIVTTYDDDAATHHETIPVSIKIGTDGFGTTAWAANTKYIYTLKVVPAENKVLFDPAVASDWETVSPAEKEI